MKTTLSLLIILFCSLGIVAQDSSSPESNALKTYFSNNTLSLHAHLNKESYFVGEEIWFALYSFDRTTSLSSKEEFNVIVSLHDENDKEIFNGLYLLQDGTAHGNILLSQKLISGSYHLKVFTPKMNALPHNEAFMRTIEIINPELDANLASDPTQMKYDIQVLPEGGYLVESIQNICGVKIVNSKGQGVAAANIQLVDQDNTTIISGIKTNTLGMGKFSFTPITGSSYRLLASLEGQKQNIELPKIRTRGLVMRTQQNFTTGDIQVILQTNINTLPELTETPITLMIHKDGLSKSFEVEFSNNYPTIEFKIPNQMLYAGVNTITLFNQLKEPILERLVFNTNTDFYDGNVLAEKSSTQDSLFYSLKMIQNEQLLPTRLSISVLPIESKSIAQRDGIYASIYINPYIQGTLEEPHYYFKNRNNTKMYELDLLMLNQGWSKYKWPLIFNYKEAPAYFDNDPGITLSGSFRLRDEKEVPSKILLYAEEDRIFETQDVGIDKEFIWNKLPLMGGQKISLSILNTEDQPIKSDIFYSYTPGTKDRHLRFPMSKSPLKNGIATIQSIIEKEEDRTQLEEAVVTAKKKKYEQYFKGWFSPTIDVGERNRGNLRAFIETFGYWRNVDGGVHREIYGMDGRTWISVRPKIIVDGIPYDDKFIADALNMKDVDEIYVDRKGKIHVFVVFTDQTWARNTPAKTAKEIVITDWGYTATKSFYTPVYTQLDSNEFKNYGVVSWHPEVKTDAKGEATISFENPSNKDLIIHGEGIDANGKPISFVTELKVASQK